MIKIYHTTCCGVEQIDGISDPDTPEAALRGLQWNLLNLYDQGFVVPFITFTGVVELAPKLDDAVLGHARSGRKDNYGEAFATYLKKSGLGNVVSSSPRKSWSGNVLKIWIWEPNWDRLIPYLEALGR